MIHSVPPRSWHDNFRDGKQRKRCPSVSLNVGLNRARRTQSSIWKEFMRLFTTKVPVPLNVPHFVETRDRRESDEFQKYPPSPSVLALTRSNVWRPSLPGYVFSRTYRYIFRRGNACPVLTIYGSPYRYDRSVARSKIKLMRPSYFSVLCFRSLCRDIQVSTTREMRVSIYLFT